MTDDQRGRFGCIDCPNTLDAKPGRLGCDECGKCYEGVHRGDTLEIWDAENVVKTFEQATVFECQFCDAVHESRSAHQDHVESQHYTQLFTDGGETA